MVGCETADRLARHWNIAERLCFSVSRSQRANWEWPWLLKLQNSSDMPLPRRPQLLFLPALDRVSIVVKRHHAYGNSYRGKNLTEAGLLFSDLVHCYHGRKHGNTQSDRVLER